MTNSITDTATNDHIADHVQRIVQIGQEKIIGTKDAVIGKADTIVGQLVDAIRARPLAAVGVAFSIGYVAMRLFRR